MLKYKVFILFFLIASGPFCLNAKGIASGNTSNLFFIENKGQLKDQDAHPRNDIQYILRDNGINVFIGDGNIHYQFYKSHVILPEKKQLLKKNLLCLLPGDIETYRMDVELVGADITGGIIQEDPLPYYENYALPGCSTKSIQAHTCKKITYKNIYPNIDWVMYIKDNQLQQEFVVRPGGDASAIKLRYNGQTSLHINEDGSVTAATPMGIVTEQTPICYLSDHSKAMVSYKLNGNILCYNTEDHAQAFVIDPTLEWGTYYGPDTSSSPLYCVTNDDNANVYACGFTYATNNIASTGSYHASYDANGDAYMVKFDSSGNRLWATYYGGSGLDWAYCVTCDHFGNVYLGGFTGSADSIATPGSHQSALGAAGATNGFLAKFTSTGTIIWATYYGGDQEDEIFSISCDNFDHVIIAGSASSTFNIATPGSFEDSFYNPGAQNVVGFIAEFNTAGVRLWGTYFKAYQDTIGDIADIYDFSACTDGNNIFATGYTAGIDSVSTPGCWQPVAGGGGDAIIIKFDNSGNRLWATFYGGALQEVVGSIACDKNGNIYLLGATQSDSAIASPGCWQPLRGGGADAFLAAFEPIAGMRQWGTYYGGPADEDVYFSHISANIAADVYISGITQSTSGIASPAYAWQTTFGGGTYDAFLAEYTLSGAQLWSTYYGGSSDDKAYGCATDGINVYVCGRTNSTNNIATPGSFDTSYNSGPYYDKGFLAKFIEPCDSAPVASFSTAGTGNITTFTYTGTPGGIDIVIWSFGDSTYASGLIANHVYAATDTYYVCATVYTFCGIDSFCSNVVISCLTAPIASFTDTGIAPTGFAYTGTTAGLDSVVWNFGDGSTDTGILASHTYTTIDTSYTVCVTSYTNCGIDSICNPVFISDLGVQSMAVTNIHVYPNPAGDMLSVTGIPENTDYNILTVTGICIQQGSLHPGNNVITMDSILPGIYMLEIANSNGGKIITRIVKE